VKKYLARMIAAVGALFISLSAMGLYNRFTLDPRESLLVAMMVAGVLLFALGLRRALPVASVAHVDGGRGGAG
jgi:hypothetical protein